MIIDLSRIFKLHILILVKQIIIIVVISRVFEPLHLFILLGGTLTRIPKFLKLLTEEEKKMSVESKNEKKVKLRRKSERRFSTPAVIFFLPTLPQVVEGAAHPDEEIAIMSKRGAEMCICISIWDKVPNFTIFEGPPDSWTLFNTHIYMVLRSKQYSFGGIWIMPFTINTIELLGFRPGIRVGTCT